jgi:hypothetical protein
MMGAAPGHRFVVHEVEALLTNILNRVYDYNLERKMCRDMGTPWEVWKMRASIILSLSGPCLLGGAVKNKALGRSNYLSKYDPGWLIAEDIVRANNGNVEIGGALLLIASRADMGSLRFSDVDRKIMAASTGMNELSKDPTLTLEECHQVQEVMSSHIYYSRFKHVNDAFGA